MEWEGTLQIIKLETLAELGGDRPGELVACHHSKKQSQKQRPKNTLLSQTLRNEREKGGGSTAEGGSYRPDRDESFPISVGMVPVRLFASRSLEEKTVILDLKGNEGSGLIQRYQSRNGSQLGGNRP